MEIYEIDADDGFDWVTPEHSSSVVSILREIQDKPLGEKWSPVRVKRLAVVGDRVRQSSDFPWLASGILVLSERAKRALSSLLESYGELLPLESEDLPLWVYNSLTMVDALDLEAASVMRMPESNRIIGIDDYAFLEDRVGDVPIFHLPYPHPSRLFVSGNFLEILDSHGLKGFGARLVWE